ncbi:MAG: signal peptide peptidase SppA [Syntrophorhabdaceae bacterium]|nr:signal peptide peptidase SppA [Syntrophorhabdaceae bacterium]
MEEKLLNPPPRRSLFRIGCMIMILIPAALFLLMMGVSLLGNFSMSVSKKVAVVPVNGVISDSEQLLEHLRRYGKDNSVKAVVLRINSPGGGVAPSQEIYEEVRRLDAKKPVLTSMGSIAASGGYYIASGSRKIYANPGTMTGSIGVVMPFVNMKDLVDRIGIKGMAVKSGEFKDTGSPLREMTPEEREVLQSVVDNVHMQFVNAVAQGRKLPPEDVMGIADGRIFTGEQAKALGLVDELGALDDAVREAALLGGISGEPRVITPPKAKVSLLNLIREEVRSMIHGTTDGGIIPLQLN